jgi:hypothetical protein
MFSERKTGFMTAVAESNVLLREQAEMPSGFKVATDESYDGWKLMRSGGIRRLAKKIETRGWSFTPTADGLPRSGVGKTSVEAIDSALNQVLQRVGADSSAVEIERIELTQYPWFYLARVCVHPYRIKEGTAEHASLGSGSARARRKSIASAGAAVGPQMQSAMPMLKDLLTSTGGRTA